MTRTISVLFGEPPERWGLRGDPPLWEEMESRFSDSPMPTSEDELVREFSEKFEELTGSKLEGPDERIHVERYRIGHGMSDGIVSVVFWRDTALSLVRDRYAAIAP